MDIKNDDSSCFNCQYYMAHYIKIADEYFITACGTCTCQHYQPQAIFYSCKDWKKRDTDS